MSDLALTFNDLLDLEGIDPAVVVLVRHQDAGRQTRSLSLYQVWKNAPATLEAYQAIQHRTVFEPGQLVASFVVTPHPETATLFVGLYSVDAVGTVPQAQPTQFSATTCPARFSTC